MRVKINDTWYDSSDVPICLHMHQKEKDQIAAMDLKVAPDLKYAIVPQEWSAEKIKEWMEIAEIVSRTVTERDAKEEK